MAERPDGPETHAYRIRQLEHMSERLWDEKASLRELEEIKRTIAQVVAELHNLLVELTAVRVRVGLYSAIGGLAGAGIVSLAVALVSRGG